MPATQPEPARPTGDPGEEIDPRRVLAARRLRLLESDLYLVLGPVPGKDIEETVREAIAGGVDIVQLRAKDWSDEELVATGERLARLCHAERVMFIINDRPDLVDAIGADGVHVGQDDLSVAEARRIAGPAALVGVSTHEPDQLAQAAKDGADYAGVGPVHTTPTKPGRPATGYRYVHHASLHAELPWFAIGGIDESTVDRTLASGAERIVVVRAIAEAGDPRAAAKALKTAIAERPRRASAEERNAAVRAQIRPFEPGERPAAAAIAAILVAAVALTNVFLLFIGYEPREELRGSGGKLGQVLFGIAAAVLAVYVWKLKAWALLALQAIFAVSSLLLFASLLYAQSVAGAFVTVLALGVIGWLFWKLVRVLARAQAPPNAPETQDPQDPLAASTVAAGASDADAPTPSNP